MIDVRPSPIAGQWYEGNPKTLAVSIDQYLSNVELSPLDGEVMGVIAPHAGHQYSGEVAAYAFAALRGKHPDLIAVLGPMHRPFIEPLLTTKHDAYSTPLGNIAVDKTALNDLDKLKDLAKAMQQLQQQAGKMGKDLAEQLKNGQAQAAQATLEKMVKQLQEANLSPEQLDKILDEVAKAINPAGQYGKVADFLKEGVKQLQQGQKPDAAQSLAAAAKELEKLAESMSDAEALADALDALNRAQMAIATGKSWSQCQGGACSNCQGAGCSLCRGKGWGHGGRPGRGVGTWAEESGWLTYPEISERWDNTGVERPDMAPRGQTDRGDGELSENAAPTKVKGQISPGGQMPSITLKGVSIKGQSSVSYQEAVATAQTEAQSALNQDKVPRAYQGAVKNYFDDLKK